MPPPPPRVLIVEDSPTQAQAFAILLESAGMAAELAASAEQALERLRTENFQLIVTDLTLPGDSGIDLCRQLKQGEPRSNVPVIVLAGSGGVVILLKCLEAGADRFISKSRDSEEIIAPIQLMAEGGLTDAPSIRRTVRFRGEQFDLDVRPSQLIDVMLAACNDLSDSRQQLVKLNRKLEHALKNRGKIEEHLRDAEAVHLSLVELIKNILDFSEIEAGNFDLDRHPFVVHARLEDTMKSLAVQAHRKDIELACRLDADIPSALIGDFGWLRHVLVNLVDNAITFTNSGEVVLEVHVESSQDSRAELHFSVSDTGVGIPKNKLQEIFKAREQADASTTRKSSGTGLGLAVSSRLVQLMGGRFWAESEVGRGSTFHFTAAFELADGASVAPEQFPASRVAVPCDPSVYDSSSIEIEEVAGTAPSGVVAPKPQGRPDTQSELRQLKILLVEDSPTNQVLARALLSKQGHSVTVANNGFEAVAKCAADTFDVVLMDVEMPEMDGIEATARIRQHQAGTDAHVPIIAMTAHAMKGDRERCLDAGMDAYLAKPIRTEALVCALASLDAKLSTTDNVKKHFGEADVHVPESEG